jgi:hypothetical protein
VLLQLEGDLVELPPLVAGAEILADLTAALDERVSLLAVSR